MKVVLTEEEWNALKGEPSRQLHAVKLALTEALWKKTPCEFTYFRNPGDPGLTQTRCDNMEIAAREVMRSCGRPFSTREEAVKAFEGARMTYGNLRDLIEKTFDDALNTIEAVPNETNTTKT